MDGCRRRQIRRQHPNRKGSCVLVRGWNINAQGDDRPTETLQLWYDKAAMKYFSTTDGEIWAQGGITSGWDQSIDDFWDAPNSGYFKSPKLF